MENIRAEPITIQLELLTAEQEEWIHGLEDCVLKPGDARLKEMFTGPQPPLILPTPGRYRHYKGEYYRLEWVARMESTQQWMCCYWNEKTKEQWIRPAYQWEQSIDRIATKRFTKVQDKTILFLD